MTTEQEIRNADTAYGKAFNQRDAAALTALFTEDGSLLAPNTPAVRGKQAIESSFEGFFEMGARNIHLDAVEIRSNGDLAYEVGTYSLDIPSKEGGIQSDKGKFIDIYQRQPDGSWKVHVSMFNSDTPLPE